ncbi:glycoside hydrolase family 43 protein [Poronia punctata]|nr:glycoside hydrolase family 43 protein [Poronia punctata]
MTTTRKQYSMARSQLLVWLFFFFFFFLSTSLATTITEMEEEYDDSTFTLTTRGTPDPFVNFFAGQYYLTYTTGNRVEVWSSSSLVDIERSAIRHQIWTPPPNSPHSADLWAPELHAVQGRWYIYYTASDPSQGSKSHRIYILGGPSATEHPCSGQWSFLGRLRNMPEQWAIDGTVFELDGQLYLAYSGWPIPVEEQYKPEDDDDDDYLFQRKSNSRVRKDRQERISNDDDDDEDDRDCDIDMEYVNSTAQSTISANLQQIYLVRLRRPWEADTNPIAISSPEREWEITRGRNPATSFAINEGPQFLSSPDGRWRGLVFSCAGSWTNRYKMATLEYLGGPPLAASSWKKAETPLLQTKTETKTKTEGKRGKESGRNFGPGHGSFLMFAGGEVFAIYHATDRPDDGWSHRLARVQRVVFTDEGPYMGVSSTSSSSGVGVGVKRDEDGDEDEDEDEEGIMAKMWAKMRWRRRLNDGSVDDGVGNRNGEVRLRASLEGIRADERADAMSGVSEREEGDDVDVV